MGADHPDPALLRPVDVVGGTVYGYMTGPAVDRWVELARAGVLVPATTRSEDQYRRLDLPGPPPRYAVVCNGGRILVDGVVDAAWERAVRSRMAAGGVPFERVRTQAAGWLRDCPATLRTVEDLFVYLTVAERDERFEALAREAAGWAGERGWRVSLQGRKLYLLPAHLDKASAVAEVATRLGADRVVAGGDSLLDADMLRAADAAIRPAHGELHVTGFTAPRCRSTAASGLAAGDEILDWYTGQVLGGPVDVGRSNWGATCVP
jgi:hypothetical protein